MKKFLVVLAAILLTVPMMAQDFSGVTCQQGQVYNNWHKWLDYINIVMPIDIYKYEKIYLCPVDASGVQWPDKTDNKYPALEQSLEAFSGIIAKNIKKQLPNIKVLTVNSLDEIELDDKSVGLCLRFDELDMGDRALRIWVGAGAGAQKITLSGVIFDKNKQELFDFKHRRVMIIGRTYKKDLQIEFANFGKDIAKILNTLSK